MSDHPDNWLAAERERLGREVTEEDRRRADDMMLDAMLAARQPAKDERPLEASSTGAPGRRPDYQLPSRPSGAPPEFWVTQRHNHTRHVGLSRSMAYPSGVPPTSAALTTRCRPAAGEATGRR